MGISDLRIGSGFDVHAFEQGRELWIGGVQIAHFQGLAGHSDADVLIHAIVDALLGAVCLGDIGTHFPSSDPKWKNRPSAEFLTWTVGLLEKSKARVLSIDSTVIAQEPKLSAHILAIRQKLSELIGLPIDRVSVKATTTDHLGFTGRAEGIAAHSTCLVELQSV